MIHHRNQRGWRRSIGWLAAYLLVLHVALAGASTGHLFTEASDGHETASCLNGAGSSSSPAELPAQPAHGKIHCVLCAGGGSLALPAEAILAAPQALFVSALAPASEPAPAQSRGRSPHQSRAPPHMA